MTDVEAAAYLRELKDYNGQGLMSTPATRPGLPDTFFDCAFDHAIRALERNSGAQGVEYNKNPNGSYTPVVSRYVDPDGEWHAVDNPDVPVPEKTPVFVHWIDIHGRHHDDMTAVYQYGSWYWYEGCPEDSEQEVLVRITHWRRLPAPLRVEAVESQTPACPFCGKPLAPNKGWAGQVYAGYCNACDRPVGWDELAEDGS